MFAKVKIEPKVKVKLSEEKQAIFRILLENLVASGYDLCLGDKQNSITMFLNEPECLSLVLRSNGTWDLE